MLVKCWYRRYQIGGKVMQEIRKLESAGYSFCITDERNISFHRMNNTAINDVNPVELLGTIRQNKTAAMQYLEWRQQIANVVAVDIETTSLNPRDGNIKCVSYATKNVSVVTETIEEIRAILADETILKVFHNAAFDVYYLEWNGYKVKNFTDSMVMAQVLSNNEGSHRLQDLVKRELGIEIGKKLQKANHWKLELSYEHYLYSMCDAAVTRILTIKLVKQIEQKGLYQVLQREIKALPAIVRLQIDGMPFDKQTWNEELSKIQQQKEQIQQALLKELQTEINLESPKQLLQCLQNRGIPAKNTADDTLAALEQDYPVLKKLRLYRQYHKVLSLSGEKWLGHVRVDGRIYPSWRLIGATTGRMTCSSPNLQQVPHLLRPYFNASDGYCFLVADYSQIELRVIAELTKDPEMVQAFKKNADLHEKTASMILGTDNISKENRQIAKAANFGLIYGMSVEGLQKRVKTQYGMELSYKEASKFRNGFFKLYRRVRRYQEKQLDKLKISTLGGRYWTNIPTYPEQGWRNRYNYEVQGTAADGLKEALALLHPQLQNSWRLCAVVHDEIVLEVPIAEVEKAKQVLQNSMIKGMQIFIKEVPIFAEVEVSNIWQK